MPKYKPDHEDLYATHPCFICGCMVEKDGDETCGNELCEQAGWAPGDTLEWINNQDGTWTLKKQTISTSF
jgi:hypothetical protein